jgi:hypothetical protein
MSATRSNFRPALPWLASLNFSVAPGNIGGSGRLEYGSDGERLLELTVDRALDLGVKRDPDDGGVGVLVGHRIASLESYLGNRIANSPTPYRATKQCDRKLFAILSSMLAILTSPIIQLLEVIHVDE